MRISEFTGPELEFCLAHCNFTKEQAKLFDLRSRGRTIEQCADDMNMSVSTVKRVSQRVNRKIEKVYK